jgi:hypothetical protein
MAKIYHFLAKAGSHLQLPSGHVYVQAGQSLSISDPVIAKSIVEKSLSGSQFIELISTEEISEVFEPLEPEVVPEVTKNILKVQGEFYPAGFAKHNEALDSELLNVKQKLKKPQQPQQS